MYKYFTMDEMRCTHCGAYAMDDTFMQRLDQLREDMGFPFPVTSAYRCEKHPIEARKKAPGAHTSGRAVDIGVQGEEAYRLIEGAIALKFKGIFVNVGYMDNITNVEVDLKKIHSQRYSIHGISNAYVTRKDIIKTVEGFKRNILPYLGKNKENLFESIPLFLKNNITGEQKKAIEIELKA